MCITDGLKEGTRCISGCQSRGVYVCVYVRAMWWYGWDVMDELRLRWNSSYTLCLSQNCGGVFLRWWRFETSVVDEWPVIRGYGFDTGAYYSTLLLAIYSTLPFECTERRYRKREVLPHDVVSRGVGLRCEQEEMRFLLSRLWKSFTHLRRLFISLTSLRWDWVSNMGNEMCSYPVAAMFCWLCARVAYIL